MNRMRWLGWMLGLGGMLFMTTGCISRLARYDVVVHADSSLAEGGYYPSVEVHLITPDTYQAQLLERVSMSKYWDPNRSRDSFDRYMMQFGSQKPTTQVLGNRDPIWKRWNHDGGMRLFALADLPGLKLDRESVEDPRRLIIPLRYTRLWFRPRWIIDVNIGRDGLFYTPPRPAGSELYRGSVLDDQFRSNTPDLSTPEAGTKAQNSASQVQPWLQQK